MYERVVCHTGMFVSLSGMPSNISKLVENIIIMSTLNHDVALQLGTRVCVVS